MFENWTEATYRPESLMGVSDKWSVLAKPCATSQAPHASLGSHEGEVSASM